MLAEEARRAALASAASRATHCPRVRTQHPYDVLEYESSPIEWLSPERLALASVVHVGPRVKLEGYRYLELGCGNGANLVPLAFYRPHAHFVGLDAASVACASVRRKAEALGLDNLTILEADLAAEPDGLDGTFDFIVAHGVVSWVAEATRLQLLQLCQRHLAPHGLLYLSYNARPGWDVRGIVRSFLVEHTTQPGARLPARAELAQRLAATLIPPLRGSEHPFSQLLANELELVQDAHFSYVGHDYLAEHNHASDYEVEANEEPLRAALLQLGTQWPRGVPIRRLFSDPDRMRDDLLLLHENGLIELRCSEPSDGIDAARLHARERAQGYQTTAWHTRVCT